MATARSKAKGFRFHMLGGILPLNRSQVSADIMAGITLAALNIPHAMGYAKIAGTPVITGLYVILIPTVLFALFGSSRHMVVGADSATAAILAAGLTGLAALGSPDYMALCSLLALMAAGFLIVARFIGLGFLADFLSRTVLIGFLTGVGVQVSLMEIGGMLGLPEGGHGPIGCLLYDLHHLHRTNFHTLAVTVAVLAAILGSEKISKKFPGALVAVVGAIAVSWAIDLKAAGVATLGAVPSGLPNFGLPRIEVNADLLMKLLPTAFSLFVVILAQSAATSRAYATRYSERLSENTRSGGFGPGQHRGWTFWRLRGERQSHRLGDGGQRRGSQPVGPDRQQHCRAFGADLPDGASGLHAGRGLIRGGFSHLRASHRRKRHATDLPGAARRVLGGPHNRGHRGSRGSESRASCWLCSSRW